MVKQTNHKDKIQERKQQEKDDPVDQFKELVQMIQEIEDRHRPKSPEELAKLEEIDHPDYQKAKSEVIRFMSYRERSVKEIRDYLVDRKGYDVEVTEGVIQRMLDLNYLNDRRFATQWVKNRANSARRGPNLLKKELQEKGIRAELIEDIVETEFDSVREFEVACQLARKKVRSYLTKPEKAKARLCRYLESKGFRYPTIKKVVYQVLEEEIQMDCLDS